MRILQVNAFAERVGGAEVYMLALVDALAAAGHQVGLLAGTPGETLRTPDRCMVHRPEWDPRTLLSDPGFEELVGSFVAEFSPDLIHLHNLHNFPVRSIAALAAAGVPMVQTVHDAGNFCANSWLTHGNGKVCAGGVGQKCLQHGCQDNYPFDGRVMLSIKLRTEALRRTVEHWVAPSRFYSELAREHGLTPVRRIPYLASPGAQDTAPKSAHKRVLFVGRLVKEKGVEFLIRAWPAVQKQHPDAELFIAGDGPLMGDLRTAAKAVGLDPDQILRGKVPHVEVRALMQSSTLLVLPSIWVENSPLSCYEALSVGLPMVASDIGGFPDLVRPGHTGLLVPPRDSDALAKALASALGDSTRLAQWSRQCLEDAAHFVVRAHLASIEEVYAAATERGIGHRSPIDLDLVSSSNELLTQFHQVERWALDMKKHIEYLEGIGRADQPVKQFTRHLRFWLRGKQRRN